ncbi:MAG: hypothetical protein JNL99_01140 [Zoogloea sp.]|nr:hypothetical protein [Zoogloea sp.]
MSVVVSIEGRDAIPVRAIPFVTGWKLSPDVLATCLAQSSDWPSHPQNMVGHHIMQDGRIAEMLPKEWDGIVSELQSLSDALHAEEVVEQASYREWRKQSISVLPSHCFVWLDTLESACRLAWSRLTIMNERPGDKDLNLTPYIPPKLVGVVFEGLPAPDVTLQSTQVVRVRPAGIEPEQAQHQAEPVAEPHGTTGRQSQIDDQREENVSSWKAQVRSLADEEHRKAKAAGYELTKQQIADRVAAVAEKMGIRGAYAKLTPGNILREALQGDRWKRPID